MAFISAGGGEPLPALEKMMVSLGERLPATWGKASRLGFLRGIKGIVSSAWMRGNAQARQAVVEKNVELTVQAIRDRSEVMRDLEAAGQIAICGAVYDVASGKVTFCD